MAQAGGCPTEVWKKSFSCEGKAQGDNLGVFSSAADCGATAATKGYHFVMFPQRKQERSWGCRVCSEPKWAGKHRYWDLYTTPLECSAKAEKKIEKNEDKQIAADDAAVFSEKNK